MKIILFYFFLAVITMTFGLISRSNYVDFPNWVNLYLGDFLWALMVYWFICALRPESNRIFLFIYAIGLTFSIEISQLYQADWINELRSTKVGALVLGFGFKWSDLLAYSLGISLGALVNWGLINLNKSET